MRTKFIKNLVKNISEKENKLFDNLGKSILIQDSIRKRKNSVVG